MDYSKLTVTQLTAVSNAFMQIDTLMKDDLSPNFSELLTEYLAMDEIDRMQLQSEMSAKANFKAYAQALGNEDMAEALEAVAVEMSKMNAKDLKNVSIDVLTKNIK